MLPRYPSDKIILMDMAHQMISIHECQSLAHKIGLKLFITIGRYFVKSIFKACAMGEEMRRVTMWFFKARKCFDYQGMKNKFKNNYTNVHRIEDVWIYCRIEEDIQRMDYCCLTVEQIENFYLVEVLKDLEEDRDILDPTYEKDNIIGLPLPLIQWSKKENTSLRARFQGILNNTSVWLNLHGVQLKPFQAESFEEEDAGPKGKFSKLRTKNRQEPIDFKGPRFKFTVGKGENQGES